MRVFNKSMMDRTYNIHAYMKYAYEILITHLDGKR
jgi:hypothetical protein